MTPKPESAAALAEILISMLKPEWAHQLVLTSDYPNADGLEAIVLPGVAALFPSMEDENLFMVVERTDGTRNLFADPIESVVEFLLEPMRTSIRRHLKETYGME